MLARVGPRAGEVATLRLDDIDWRRGEITVWGKGNRHERLPLPSDIGEALVAYLSGFRPAAAAGREVFVGTRAPHRALTRGAVTQLVARASRRCGLGTIYAHRLRHTAATTMQMRGVTERTVMSVMGWSSTAMAARYQHVVAAIRGDVADQVGGLLGNPPTEQARGAGDDGPPTAA